MYCLPSPFNVTATLNGTYDDIDVIVHEHPKFAVPSFYHCMSVAIVRYPDYRGYLIFPDDMLVYPHRLSLLDQDKIWYTPHLKIRQYDFINRKECSDGRCERAPNWSWSVYSNKSMHDLWRSLKTNKSYSVYYQRLVKYLGTENRMLSAWSDIFYVPGVLKEEFLSMALLCYAHKVQQGAAVGTIMVAISDQPQQWLNLIGMMDTDRRRRNKPWEYYKGVSQATMIHLDYHHPVKLGYIAKGVKELIDFYCNAILPVMHSPEGRF